MIGIYKIINNITGEYYIGSSKDTERRFREHLYNLRNNGKFDCGWIPTDKSETNYSFIVLEECSIDNMISLESMYLKDSDPKLCKNIKNGEESRSNRCVNPMSGKCWCNDGTNSKVFNTYNIPEGLVPGRITGIVGLVHNNCNLHTQKLPAKSEYIDTRDLDIKILSKNEFVPLHGIICNSKKISNHLLEIVYFYKNMVRRSITVTTDHPLYTQRGRIAAENLNTFDSLFDSVDGDQYKILEINPIQTKSDTYDVETDNDLFDLSGILSHNCRTRVIGNFYDPENETTYGRGNLSFTSINLPRLAIEAKGNTEKFFKDLFATMDLVKEQLLDRLEIQSRLHVYNMPFLMGQGVWCGSDKLSYTDEIREVIKQGSLSIGFIGLAEALHALYGKHHGESEEIHNIGKQIIRDMRSRCDEYAIEHKLNFSLLATPAEGLSGRFLNIDKKKYGIIPGVTDKDYYTNSFHIPVGFDISIAKKIELEAPFHAMTNAGHITYVELDGDVASNESVFEKIILKMDKEGVGYGSINHPIDRDPVCGYTGIIHEECPNCGRKEKEDGIPHERIRRITGYLVGTLDRFNSAKLSEVLDRKKHKGFKSEDLIQ